MDAPNIFEYLDHKAFLRDWFQAKKATNPRYSHRAFVRKTGQKSPSLLADVIGGRRGLTPTTARSFCRAMGIKGAQSRFFQLLAAFDRAETTTEKNKLWNKIASTRRMEAGRQLEDAGVEFLSHWYYPVIKEMAHLPDFQADAQWIADHLRPTIPLAEVDTALEQLFTMGILVRDADGTVRPRDANIITPPEVRTLAIKNYYREMLSRAVHSLEEFRAAERHFTTITVAIPDDMVPRLKEELTQMTNRLLALCEEARGDKSQIIQINLNFHPMTTDGQSQ